MKHLLDTNILINHIRGKEIISIDILEEGAGISIITLGELYYGASKSKNPQKTLSIVRGVLQDLGLQIQTLDAEIMSEFGKMKAELEIKGTRLEDFDLLIAATAKVQNLILVTKNLKHFKRITGLKLYEPTLTD